MKNFNFLSTFQKLSSRIFKAIDLNNDGKLSLEYSKSGDVFLITFLKIQSNRLNH